jgi:acyl transferase domain-containing protein
MLLVAQLYEKSLRDAGVGYLELPINRKCEMFSSVTQSKLCPSHCTPEYWKQNMVSTVRFSAALTEAMRAHDLDTLVELGPHPALKGPTVDTLTALGKGEVKYLGSCMRNKDDFISMLETAGEMVTANIRVKCENINGLEIVNGIDAKIEAGKILTDLPRYQWDHSLSHWAESRVSQNHRLRAFSRHQLLGARSNSDTPLNATWRNILLLKEIDWLKDILVSRYPSCQLPINFLCRQPGQQLYPHALSS